MRFEQMICSKRQQILVAFTTALSDFNTNPQLRCDLHKTSANYNKTNVGKLQTTCSCLMAKKKKPLRSTKSKIISG
jgi:hypothetical protein